ncbi:hypothetical protein RQP46_007304 [Phenoliferia psychrophenolica]
MFATSHQPYVLSLLSSTASDPLLLATSASSSAFPTDAFITLLSDATDTDPTLPPSSNLKGKGVEVPRGNLRSRVLHLQAPDIRSTWVKDLAQAFFLEVGVRDERGARAVLRASTFQVEPKAYSTTPPLLHLPLAFPTPSPTVLTPWTILSLHLPTLLSSFSRLENGTSFARFASIDYVKAHANCRLRRVWCAEDGEEGEVGEGLAVRGMRTELAMFAAEVEDR